MDGGDGDDTFLVTEVRRVGAVSYAGLIDGGAGIDTLDLSAINDPFVTLRTGDSSRQTLVLFAGQDQYRLANIERILFGAGTHSYDARDPAVRFVDLGAGDDFFYSATAGTTVHGGDGSDSLRFDSNLFLYGDAGDDSFTVFVGAASGGLIDGGTGIDTVRLVGRDSNAVIDLAAGTARYGNGTFAVSGIENVFASNGVVRGDASNNVLVGIPDGVGILTLEGGGGDDVLIGTSGVDRLFGGDGDDLIEGRGSAADILDGGAGIDTVAVIISSNVSLAAGTIAVGTTTQTISGFENVRGSSEGDTIVGDGGANRLDGVAGNDLIRGGGGSDTVIGGEGDDLLYGDDGDDRLEGGVGSDTLYGGDGIDFLRGGTGSDRVYGGAGDDDLGETDFDGRLDVADFLYGEDGNDTLRNERATGGSITLDGGAGDDLIIASGNGTLNMIGGAGSDTFRIGPLFGSATIATGAGTDRIEVTGLAASIYTLDLRVTDFTTGTSGDQLNLRPLLLASGWDGTADPFVAGYLRLTQSGSDVVVSFDRDGIRTAWGFQTLLVLQNVDLQAITAYNLDGLSQSGSTAPITLVGTVGNDSLYGSGGDDVLSGREGDDLIAGGSGNDSLYGEEGRDLLLGGDGNDGLDGGEGDDTLDGGAGNDRLEGRGGNDVLSGGDGNDQLNGGLGSNQLNGGAGDDVIISGGGSDRIDGGAGRDLYVMFGNGGTADLRGSTFISVEDVVGTSGNDFIVGSSVDNRLDGGAGDDLVSGFSGDDILIGGSGNDTIDGGLGTDTAMFSGSRAASIVTASNGTFTVIGPGGADRVSNIEVFQFSDGVYDVVGGRLAAQARQTLTGTAGVDTLTGGESNDVLNGLDGNDILIGGMGSDSLNGGAGFDAALYSGVVRQYALQGGSATTVTGGPETGIDTLTGIEEARFVDGVLTFDLDSASARVMRLYDAALDRGPDQGGLETYAAALARGTVTLQSLANAFAASGEFQSRYGNLSNQAFVEQLYRFALDRNGDSAGVQAWVSNLNAGMSRGEVLVAFSESSEHRTLTASSLSRGLWIPDADAITIARLYDATFDRLPDVGGLATWTANLKAGMSLSDISAAFAGSAEFQSRYGTLSNQAFVEQLYRFCLDRNGDPAGVQTWVSNLNSGTSRAEVLRAFSESAEHINLTASSWLGGIRYQGYQGSVVESVDVGKVAHEALTLPVAHDSAITADGRHGESYSGDANWLLTPSSDLFALHITLDLPAVYTGTDAEGVEPFRMPAVPEEPIIEPLSTFIAQDGDHVLTLSADGLFNDTPFDHSVLWTVGHAEADWLH